MSSASRLSQGDKNSFVTQKIKLKRKNTIKDFLKIKFPTAGIHLSLMQPLKFSMLTRESALL